MKPIIADASAVLAYLLSEPGSHLVGEHLSELQICSVNLCEVVTVLTGRGISKDWIENRVLQVFSKVIAFDRDQAALAGNLADRAREYGLSLGDRACLAAGISTGATVLTADAVWGNLDLGVDLKLIR